MDIDDAKMKKIKDKMDTFMADVAADMLDTESITKLEKVVKKKLLEAGVGGTLPYLKAFRAGMETAIAAEQGNMAIPLIAGLNKLIQDKQIAVEDISKKSIEK